MRRPELYPTLRAHLPLDMIPRDRDRRIRAAMDRIADQGKTPDTLAVLAELERYGDLADVTKAYLLSVDEGFPSLPYPATSERLIDLCADIRSLAVPRDTQGAPSKSAVVVCLADVKTEPIDWLWPRYLARRKLHLLIGDPGVGKSFLTADLAARRSLGTSWPDGAPCEIGVTLMMTAEDGLTDTVKPRLANAGADTQRVHAVTAVSVANQERGIKLTSDLDVITRAIQQTSADVVTIDPINAFMDRTTDSRDDVAVRSVLAPLAALAERENVAVLAVMHLNKDSSRKLLYRALGSIGYVGQARVVLALGTDPQQPTRRVLATVKNNISEEAPMLAYRIVDGKLVWESSPVEDTTREALFGPPPTPAEAKTKRDTVTFLRELLESAPDCEMAATEVTSAALANHMTEKQLRNAREELGIKPYRLGFQGPWRWRLPRSNDALSSEKGIINHAVETKPDSSTSYAMVPDEDREGIIDESAGNIGPTREF